MPALGMQNVLQDQAQMAYTDIAALRAQDTRGEAGLSQAAEQFESLFIDWVLKSMREANATLAKGSYLSSSEVEMHQKMLDNQTAMNLSNSGGLGLKALIMDQLRGGVSADGVSVRGDSAKEVASAADTQLQETYSVRSEV